GPMINRATSHLFRRHVAGSPHHGSRISMDASSGDFSLRYVACWLEKLGKTKIQNLHPVVIGYKEIVGFEVAMDDSFFVRRCESVSNLHRVIHCFALRYRSLVQSFPKGFTFKQFGNDVRSSFMSADVINNQYVRMIERARCLCFLFKAA